MIGPDTTYKLQGLIFDIDGVIFDSRSSNMEYYNLIRRAVQLGPLTPEEEDYCQMASVEQALAHIIPPEYREEAATACKTIDYRKQILPLLSVEPGLLELLTWLKLYDVRLGICTNRGGGVDDLLRYFSLESFFSPVMTAKICPPKPYPDGLLRILETWDLSPSEVPFLGDSKVDAQAAAAAGVPFWAFRSPLLTAELHFDDFFSMITLITPLVEGR
jgi:phosphoglycolate phosphatase-like HAD superfamily hydrolase